MIYLLLISGFILRLLVHKTGTYWGDMNCWISWSDQLTAGGFKNFYSQWSDYLPGYLYLLWILGQLKNFLQYLGLSIAPQLLYKLPSLLADLGTGYLLYQLGQKFKNKKAGLLAASLYIFNPAILANSTLWGQTDSFFTFVVFLASYLLIKNNFIWSALILGLSLVTKPLAFFILPLIFIYLWQKKSFKTTCLYFLTILLTSLITFIPFYSGGGFFLFIFQRLQITFNQYPYTSLNAFNFWGLILPLWSSDKTSFLNLSFKSWGMIVFMILNAVILFSFYQLLKQSKNPKKQKNLFFFFSMGLVFFSSFMFLTRMHERHLLPAFAFLNLASLAFPLLWLVYFFSSLIYVLNLYYAFVYLTQNFHLIFPVTLIKILAGCQLINFLFLIFLFSKKLWPKIKK